MFSQFLLKYLDILAEFPKVVAENTIEFDTTSYETDVMNFQAKSKLSIF